MGHEIERKYLVKHVEFLAGLAGTRLCQGYTSLPEGLLRIRTAGDRAFLTIKGRNEGLRRAEYEYEIPVTDARELLAHICKGPVVDKTRYEIPHGELTWEVDVFHGENEGLVLAEIELDAEDTSFDLPQWLGEEVSHDPRYFSSYLAKTPFRSWRS